jgi:hypothetical protein
MMDVFEVGLLLLIQKVDNSKENTQHRAAED